MSDAREAGLPQPAHDRQIRRTGAGNTSRTVLGEKETDR